MKPEFQGNWVDGDVISTEREYKKESGFGGLAMSEIPGNSQMEMQGRQVDVKLSRVGESDKGLEEYGGGLK